MSETKILVTGAARGRVGAVGHALTRLLLERGVPVRAMVRRLDERAGELRQLGAEVVVGDLLDFPSVRAAMDGVSRACFIYLTDHGLLDATAVFAAAGRAAGLEQVVNLSQLKPEPTAGSPRMRQHWFSEQVLEWAGMGPVHLRAGLFFETFRLLAAQTVAAQNLMLLSGADGQTVFPLISAVDVARVAAGVLTRPVGSVPQAIPLVGELLTANEMVQAMSAALGRPIQYREVPDPAWRAAVEGLTPHHAINHLSSLWRVLRSTGKKGVDVFQVTGAIQEIGGRTPMTFEEYVREHAAEFSPGRMPL